MNYIKIPCSCLIDQHRCIGDDPIGHACTNLASIRLDDKNGNEAFICKTCENLLVTDNNRVIIQWTQKAK